MVKMWKYFLANVIWWINFFRSIHNCPWDGNIFSFALTLPLKGIEEPTSSQTIFTEEQFQITYLSFYFGWEFWMGVFVMEKYILWFLFISNSSLSEYVSQLVLTRNRTHFRMLSRCIYLQNFEKKKTHCIMGNHRLTATPKKGTN